MSLLDAQIAREGYARIGRPGLVLSWCSDSKQYRNPKGEVYHLTVNDIMREDWSVIDD